MKLIFELGLFILCTLGFQHREALAATPAMPGDANRCEELFDKSNPTEVKKTGRRLSPEREMLANLVQKTGLQMAQAAVIESKYHDTHYNLELPMGPIDKQGQSGRCWLEGSMSNLESKGITDGKLLPGTRISRVLGLYWLLYEHAEMHVDQVIEMRKNFHTDTAQNVINGITPHVQDGYDPQDAIPLTKRHGAVPEQAMPETADSQDTAALLVEINNYLLVKTYELWNFSESFNRKRPLANRDLQTSFSLPELTSQQLVLLEQKKQEILEGIRERLEISLGTPPETFEMRVPVPGRTDEYMMKSFTPNSLVEYLEYDPSEWVRVSNYASRKHNEVIKVMIHSIDPSYWILNVGADRMMELIQADLLKKRPVGLGLQMGDRLGVNKNGDMIKGTTGLRGLYSTKNGQRPPQLSQNERELLGLKNADHFVLVTGSDTPVGLFEWVKIKIQNSWGKTAGRHGIFALFRSLFPETVADAYIHISSLNDKERAIFKKGIENENPPVIIEIP